MPDCFLLKKKDIIINSYQQGGKTLTVFPSPIEKMGKGKARVVKEQTGKERAEEKRQC